MIAERLSIDSLRDIQNEPVPGPALPTLVALPNPGLSPPSAAD